MVAANIKRKIDCKTVSDNPWGIIQAWFGNHAVGISLAKQTAFSEAKRNLNKQHQQKGGGYNKNS